MVNRVKRARLIHELLSKKLAQIQAGRADTPAAGPVLLFGRSRELDREDLLEKILPRMQAQRDEKVDAEPLFLVATQCVEAGADLDFDALVTELAPLDALRQRFGRLNRMGRKISASAVIVAAKEQVGAKADDVLYGAAPRETWKLLGEKATTEGKGKSARRTIDFGIQAAAGWLPEGQELGPYLSPRLDAPRMLPAYIDLWSQTSPIPAVDPEVALFLHGPNSNPGDVELVWRDDLDDPRSGEVPEGDAEERSASLEQRWIDRVRACPPTGPEILSLPIGEVRRWLSGQVGGDVSDVEGEREQEQARGQGGKGHMPLRWCGAEDSRTRRITPDKLKPGDVLVVPSSWHGCDRFGWAPASKADVRDLAEKAMFTQRGRTVVRLSALRAERLWSEEGEDPGRAARRARAERIHALLRRLADVADRNLLGELQEADGIPSAWRRLSQHGERVTVIRDDDEVPLALEWPKSLVRKDQATKEKENTGGMDAEATTEGDEGTRRPGLRRVKLTDHSRGVRDKAGEFVRQLGLGPRLAADLKLAGFLHDAGKAHPQFKLWLYDGDELAAQGEPLAKSGQTRLGKRAREQAGLPLQARHEAASVRFALSHRKLILEDGECDRDLVLWLIGTHHGWGRPFFPLVDWPPAPKDPVQVDLGDGETMTLHRSSIADLGAGWVDLFARLKARYGPWRLAWLEGVIRLADHRCSQEEQETPRQSGKEERDAVPSV